MDEINLDPVGWITTGAIGEPGERVFYLQAEKDGRLMTLLVEKEQVAALVEHVDVLLARVGAPPAEEQTVAGELRNPVQPRFRVRQMAMGWDAERKRVLLECDELVEEGDEEPGSVVRIWASRGQMRALGTRGADVLAQGRPTCELCGRVQVPGHFCPPSNGYLDYGDE